MKSGMFVCFERTSREVQLSLQYRSKRRIFFSSALYRVSKIRKNSMEAKVISIGLALEPGVVTEVMKVLFFIWEG